MNQCLGLWIRIGAILFVLGTALSPIVAGTEAPASSELDKTQLLEGGQAPYRTIGQSPPPNPPNRFVYFHLDHLGSPRLTLDESGATVSQHHYLAFGEELPAPASPDPTMNRRAFTGHERDTESGLDYMLARYYSSGLGRFMAVDPGDDTALENPQSWNRYAYVGNNPIGNVDPDGRLAETALDIYSYQQSSADFSQAVTSFAASPSVAGAINVVSTLLVATGDAAAMFTPGIPAVGGLTSKATKAGVTVLDNAAKGKAAEQAVAGELKAEGAKILGSQVQAETSQGTRVIDHLVEEGGTIGAVEVKSGNATRNSSQVAKDGAMASEGAKFKGKNAPENLKGKTVKIETQVRKPKENP